MQDLSHRIIVLVIAANAVVLVYFVVRFGFVWLIGRWVDRDFTLRRILAMRRLGLDPRIVIRARERAIRLAVNIPIDRIQRHYEHGGDPLRVVEAMRAARDQGRVLGWEGACRIDLEGLDLEEAARTGLDPGTGESLTR